MGPPRAQAVCSEPGARAAVSPDPVAPTRTQRPPELVSGHRPAQAPSTLRRAKTPSAAAPGRQAWAAWGRAAHPHRDKITQGACSFVLCIGQRAWAAATGADEVPAELAPVLSGQQREHPEPSWSTAHPPACRPTRSTQSLARHTHSPREAGCTRREPQRGAGGGATELSPGLPAETTAALSPQGGGSARRRGTTQECRPGGRLPPWGRGSGGSYGEGTVELEDVGTAETGVGPGPAASRKALQLSMRPLIYRRAAEP